MSNKTNAKPLDALRAHAQAAKALGEAKNRMRREGSWDKFEIYRLEDVLKKWYYIYTDPMGRGRRYIRSAQPDTVLREVKYQPPVELPRGYLLTQIGPPATGKSERAARWLAEDPENRRIVDGDFAEAKRLTAEGYNVMLNLLP